MEENGVTNVSDRKMSGIFERYLTLWVGLSTVAGIVLGKLAPGLAQTLDSMAIYINDAPVVSIPIAICLFFMMYPIMVKIDFGSVIKAGKSGKPLFLTLFINWCVKPFTMYGISLLFLGVLFQGFIGPEATDLVKMPFGLDLPVGSTHGAGTVVMYEGVKMLEIPLWRSYLAGTILLGIAPCTAMVLVWGYLARGNDGLTLVLVAINSLIMLVLYGLLGGFLLGVGAFARALASIAFVHRNLCRVAFGGWISLAQMVNCCKRRDLVQGEVFACVDAGDDHRSFNHAHFAF